MSDVPGCAHSIIHKVTRPEGKNDVEVEHWTCIVCGLEWMPPWIAREYRDSIDRQDAVLDTTAATFSAILWDIMERTRDVFGNAAVPDSAVPDGDSESAHDCEADGHDWNDDRTCKHCGAAFFLGGA